MLITSILFEFGSDIPWTGFLGSDRNAAWWLITKVTFFSKCHSKIKNKQILQQRVKSSRKTSSTHL
jgi:hypothetical protein